MKASTILIEGYLGNLPVTLKFSIKIYRGNKALSPAAMFLTYHDGLNNVGRGSSSVLQSYIEIVPVVSDKKIFIFF